MKRTVLAFLCGMIVSAASFLPQGDGSVAEDALPGLFFDMGTAHVQYPDDDCGMRTLAVVYQLEYASDDRTSLMTAYKPKVEAAVFSALSDHLTQTGNTRTGAVKRIMSGAVAGALGDGIVDDIVITEIRAIAM